MEKLGKTGTIKLSPLTPLSSKSSRMCTIFREEGTRFLLFTQTEGSLASLPNNPPPFLPPLKRSTGLSVTCTIGRAKYRFLSTLWTNWHRRKGNRIEIETKILFFPPETSSRTQPNPIHGSRNVSALIFAVFEAGFYLRPGRGSF